MATKPTNSGATTGYEAEPLFATLSSPIKPESGDNEAVVGAHP